MATGKKPIQDDFKYDIDIDKTYNDFIKLIDSIRSYVNISDPNNSNALKKITSDIFTGSGSNGSITAEKTPQESRCHAFYRMIGFPVVSLDEKIYNPGYDIIYNKDKKLTIDDKIFYANNQLYGFNELSNEREKYVNNFLKIFSNNKSVDAGVLSLSLLNFRKFNSVFDKNQDAIETKFLASNQGYKVDDSSLVGTNSNIKFIDYIDQENNTLTKYTNERLHIIKPFVVDARIDITTPAYNKVAVPFVINSSQLKVDNTKSVKRPIIEKIIIDKFNTDNQKSKAGTANQAIIDSLKNIPVIKDEKIVKDISSGKLYGISEQQKFVQTINMIRALMIELYNYKRIVKTIQCQYYWLPLPGVKGPEDGFSIRPVFHNCYYQDNVDKFQTLSDFAIVKCQFRESLESINSLAGNVTSVPDVAGQSTDQNVPPFFDETTTDSLGNTNTNDLKRLLTQREQDLNSAGDALRKIEIITGEFSGLGLIDIAVIMGALYLMPANSLLGFLDPDAYTRAKSYIKSLPAANPSDIKTALTDLTNSVKNLYEITQKISENFEKTNTNQ